MDHFIGANGTWFDIYSAQHCQLLSEKQNSEPFLHSEKAQNLKILELKPENAELFMNNQLARMISQLGSMGVEFNNAWIGAQNTHVGRKSLATTFTLITLVKLSKNLKQITFLKANKQKKGILITLVKSIAATWDCR